MYAIVRGLLLTTLLTLPGPVWAGRAKPQPKAQTKPKPKPAPQLVAEGLPGARSLEFDRRNLYLLSDEGVFRVPREGGAALMLAEASGASSLNLQRDRLYWLESGSGAVRTVRIDGGEAQVLAEGRKNAKLLQSDLYGLYWVEESTEQPVVFSMHRRGSATTELAHLFSPMTDLQASGSHLYWADHNGEIQQIGKFGGAPEVLHREKLAPGGVLAVDERWLFWAHPVAKTVQRKGRTGGKAVVLATADRTPVAIALDKANVYWAVEPGEGKAAIVRVPKRGGKAITVAEAEGPVSELTVQDGWLYWIEGEPATRSVKRLKL